MRSAIEAVREGERMVAGWLDSLHTMRQVLMSHSIALGRLRTLTAWDAAIDQLGAELDGLGRRLTALAEAAAPVQWDALLRRQEIAEAEGSLAGPTSSVSGASISLAGVNPRSTWQLDGSSAAGTTPAHHVTK